MKLEICSLVLATTILFGNMLNIPNVSLSSEISDDYYKLIEPYNEIASEYGIEIYIPEENREAFFNEVTLEEFEDALYLYKDIEVNVYDVSSSEMIDNDNSVLPTSMAASHTWVKTAYISTGMSLTAYINGTYLRNKITSCTSVTSSITGLTLGDTYSQTSYSYNINSTGSQMTVDVYGTLRINIFVEGIGTIATKSIHKTFTCTPA